MSGRAQVHLLSVYNETVLETVILQDQGTVGAALAFQPLLPLPIYARFNKLSAAEKKEVRHGLHRRGRRGRARAMPQGSGVEGRALRARPETHYHPPPTALPAPHPVSPRSPGEQAKANAPRDYSSSVVACQGTVYLLGPSSVRQAKMHSITQRLEALKEAGHWLRALALMLEHFQQHCGEHSASPRRKGPMASPDGRDRGGSGSTAARVTQAEVAERMTQRMANRAASLLMECVAPPQSAHRLPPQPSCFVRLWSQGLVVCADTAMLSATPSAALPCGGPRHPPTSHACGIRLAIRPRPVRLLNARASVEWPPRPRSLLPAPGTWTSRCAR